MKLKNVGPRGDYIVPVVIARPNDPAGDIVFQCRGVKDFAEFDEVCPEPNPPTILKNGVQTADVSDPEYVRAQNQRGKKRYTYTMVASLSATEGLEWETVDLKKPSTWGHWRQELLDYGLAETEINLVLAGILEANGLNQAQNDAAYERFLRGREAARSASTSRDSGPDSTPSSARVSERPGRSVPQSTNSE